jgi:hypothetical protein
MPASMRLRVLVALLPALGLSTVRTFAAAPAAHADRAGSADSTVPADPLSTVGERTQYEQTGRYDEVLTLCRAFARRHRRQVRCTDLGRTPEGRPIAALVVSADGKLDPASARRAGRPTIFVVGGIHAGEIDGKDASFAALRDLLAGRGPVAALEAVTLVIVPVFNVDGHERFGPNQRPNQRGPRETGFRTTAQNLNLNRDWLKAEAPEMVALLAAMQAWDPVMLVDLHVTDGAKFEHDVAVMISPEEPTPPALHAAGRALSDAVMADLAGRGHLPLPFYPSFRNGNDPQSGIDTSPGSPRFSNRYLSIRNRLGVLVETHSWRPYPYRVRTTRAVLEAILLQASKNAPAWLAAAGEADRASERLAGTDVPLSWKATPEARTIDFRGYAYTREPSELSSGTWLRYDESRPQIWKVPLYDRLSPRESVRAPQGGYLVPAAFAGWVGPKLALHGVRFERVTRELPRVEGESFRAETVKFASSPFEGRFGAQVEGRWQPEARAVGAGALFVPIEQPRALLLVHLLEPTAPDSLVSWGYFHAAFEQKEYMEDYVLEEEARKMLARDPKLRAAFDTEVARDPTMAKDARRRLRFFYRRHPAWDERHNLYPILRLRARP